MELNTRNTPAELALVDDQGFSALQLQLELKGVDLHRVTGAFGREAFTVNVRGTLRTLDTLPQVQAYVRCLGVQGGLC